MSDISVVRSIQKKGQQIGFNYMKTIFENSSVVIGNDDEILGYAFGKSPRLLLEEKGLDIDVLDYLHDKHVESIIDLNPDSAIDEVIKLVATKKISRNLGVNLVGALETRTAYIDLIERAAQEIDAEYVAITCGRHGAAAYSKKNKDFVHRLSRTLAKDDLGDTNGAGDAFAGGFIHILTAGENPNLEAAIDTGQYLAYQQLLAIGGNPIESEQT